MFNEASTYFDCKKIIFFNSGNSLSGSGLRFLAGSGSGSGFYEYVSETLSSQLTFNAALKP